VLNSPVWRGRPTLAFCLGLLTGGLLVAAALLVVGSLLRLPLPLWLRLFVVAAAAVAVVLRESGVLRFTLPENRRLVPETVFRLGRFLGPYQFGIEMGSGVRTYLPTGLPYVAAVAVLLLATPSTAVAAGAGFSIGRSLMTVSNLRYSDDNGWDDEWSAHQRTVKPLLLAAFAASLAVILAVGPR
jgi:hypothetical protein